MRKLLANAALVLLLLVHSALAQTQGGLPTLIQSNVGPGTNAPCSFSTYCITTPEPVTAGNELVVCMMHDSNSLPPWTVTDDSSPANSWTVESTTGNTGIGGGTLYFSIAHAQATNTQVLHIQIGFPGGTTSNNFDYDFNEWSNLSDTVDGSLLTSNAGLSAGNPTVTDTHTTTTNGDVLFGCIVANMSAASTVGAATNEGLSDQPNTGEVIGYVFTGTVGSWPITGAAWNGNSNARVGILSMALKPPALAIVDTQMPDCAVSVYCQMNLHSVGGTSTPSYSVLSGSMPLGMSMSGNTISGTPTATGTSTLKFQVASGSSTATKTLNIKVGSSFGTPNVAQTIVGTFNNGGAHQDFSSPVGCGDVILMCMVDADDTHGTTGWPQKINGTNNFYSDDLGSPIQRIPNTMPGIGIGPQSCVVIGPVLATGTNGVKGFNNQNATSSLGYAAYDIQNVQALAEPGAFTNTNPTGSSSNSLGVTYSTPVDNMLVDFTAESQDSSSSFSTPTGFTLQNSGCGFSCSIMTTKLVTSRGAVNPSTTVTQHAVISTVNAGLAVGLRPALPFACPVSPAPRHRTDLK